MRKSVANDALPTSTQVLIVGGGPVGSALGIELSSRGIDCVVVETNAELPTVPVKAMLLNSRTLEHMHRWGFADELRSASTTPRAWQKGITYATSLTGKELGHFRDGFEFRATEEGDDTGESAQVIMQPDTVRILREKLIGFGGHYVGGWTVKEITQDESGCVVELEHSETKEKRSISSDYVAGCDGAWSTVLTSAGIERSGRGGIAAVLLLHFRVPGLLEDTKISPAAFTSLSHPQGGATIVPIGDDAFCAHIPGFPVDVDVSKINTDAIARRVIGSDRPFEFTYIGAYKIHELVAETYRANRLFVAGDAAHLHAPAGGHNMNSGLADAVDLGWKLAAVLQGWAGDGLLESYTAERRPIAVKNAALASANIARLVGTTMAVEAEMSRVDFEAPTMKAETRRRKWGDKLWQGTRLQYVVRGTTVDNRYVSDVIVDDGSVVAPWDSTTYQVSSKPGHRAPHVRLTDGTSLYDQFSSGFTLVTREGFEAESKEFEAAAESLGIPLSTLVLTNRRALAKYASPLVLVRPDQHVAWRGDNTDSASAVLQQVTGRIQGTANRGEVKIDNQEESRQKMSKELATGIPGYKIGTWTIDAVHSDVSFTVRHMMVSKVRGRFSTIEGGIVTGDDVFGSSVTVTIDLASIDTNNPQRDNHIKSADFLETEKYPAMVFTSTGIRAKGDDYIIDGTLDLHGVKKDVALATSLEGFGPDAYGGYRAGFSATTEISRADFGIDIAMPLDGGGVVVGDKISISIDIEAILNSQ
ncbi:FAD-dependent monooxygenase [Streptomyces sp. NPDC096311]|uniref:FAD-dependent monooxygenase n=1 Tax=Streptomyces sp. NPDC096311 TaxID=3366083 RepID=UPI00382DECC9